MLRAFSFSTQTLGTRFFAEAAAKAATENIAKETAKSTSQKVENQAPKDKPEEKQPTIEELQQQIKQIRERNLFLIAEVENARRRFLRLEEELKLTAITDMAKKLLPIADNFTRLIDNGEKQDIKAAIQAVKLIDSDFQKVFKSFQIEKIISKGQKFDPKYHDAIQMIDTKGTKPSGEVLDVITEGYKLGDRLLRAAKVIVAK